MAIRCVIFDVGDTLLLSKKAEGETVKKGIEWRKIIDFGYKVTKNQYVRVALNIQKKYRTMSYSRRNGLRIPKMILKKLGIPARNDLATEMNIAFIKYKKAHTNPPAGIKNVLEKLRNKNITLAILSNTLTRRSINRLKKLGLLHFFSHIILSFEVGVGKPNPIIFDLLIRKMTIGALPL